MQQRAQKQAVITIVAVGIVAITAPNGILLCRDGILGAISSDRVAFVISKEFIFSAFPLSFVSRRDQTFPCFLVFFAPLLDRLCFRLLRCVCLR